MSIRPKQLSRIGEFHLQEAILDVLCNAYTDEHGIGAAEIGRKAGVYRETSAVGLNDAMVHGLLNQLHEQGKVEQAPQKNTRGGWRLTAREYERRREDIDSG